MPAAWRPAGLVYLLILLACLAGGLWPDVLYPSRGTPNPNNPPPVLQAVAVGQAAFVLLIYPLAVLRRSVRPTRRFWAPLVLESAVYLVVAAPFYIAAWYLSDAVFADVVRTALYVTCLMPVAWAAAAHLAVSRRRAVITLALLLAALGLPWAYYVAAEFLGQGRAGWLRCLAPAMFVWRTAAARSGDWLPRPIWAALVWPTIAAAGVLLTLLPGRAGKPGNSR
ncbi:MAG: hypothetical protein SVT52_05190 [Planctomycetota bacterium]|nr:hypothetical protein [Planctomycetota bacterium]